MHTLYNTNLWKKIFWRTTKTVHTLDRIADKDTEPENRTTLIKAHYDLNYAALLLLEMYSTYTNPYRSAHMLNIHKDGLNCNKSLFMHCTFMLCKFEIVE